MAEKPDDIVKQLLEEGKRKGSLTYTQINNLLEDQFLPPDRMDAVITALEDAGVELIDDPETGPGQIADIEEDSSRVRMESDDSEDSDEPAEPLFPKGSIPEKIDDPVRMYLTQMGEIPLLTRDQEIFLAKTIEITRKRFRKKAVGSGLTMNEALKVLDAVQRGELAFDRTLKVNPNPKPDDDPKIVETLGKNFLAKRLPVNLETIRRMVERIREEYRPLLDEELPRARRSEQLEKVQSIRRKLVILVEECHLQVKKIRPCIEKMDNQYREMRTIERKIAALKGLPKAKDQVRELQDRLMELELEALEPTHRLKR
ncbi:MAG: RNA polymerase sigma factor region1.1 domain-containing protein, partial [Planctomycetia bacterium]